jgi:sec-independent protein translocase protein TatA
MFGLSPLELMVVGVVAILLFGSKLPEVARSLGGSYREFRKGLNDFQDTMRAAELDTPPKKPLNSDIDDEDRYSEPTAPKFVPPGQDQSS